MIYMQKIVPCLWFSNQAEEAAEYYVSVFRDSGIVDGSASERAVERLKAV